MTTTEEADAAAGTVRDLRTQVDELNAARRVLSILKSLNLRPRKLEIVSCPSCGRAQVDVYTLAEQVTAGLEGMEIPLRVAVMGCVVNGPGEARDADLGAMVRQHASDPSAHATLREALRRPSLYDEALSLLARRGLPVPERVLRRDPTAAYESDAAAEQVWASVFRRPAEDPLPVLGEALTDVADVVRRWRAEHLTVVRRAMGAKSGSAGTSGVSYLQRRAERSVFPELWTARTWV